MKNYSTILLLALIAIVGVFTLDVYLPAMPTMANELDVSIDQIALTFTGFSIVFAFSQLIHGILSDRFGRKPILLIGLSIAAIATFLCIIAKSYNYLLLVRLMQALGISSFVVLNAIIRDMYTGVSAIQVRTFVTTVSGISISIAPTIGSLLMDKFSWQGGFIASLVLILTALVYAALFFKESNKAKTKLSPKRIVTSYASLFTTKEYVLHVIQATLSYSVHFVFIIMSAKIFIQKLGFNPLAFGYVMLGYGVVYFINGFLSNSLIKKYSSIKLINIGGLLIALSGLVMLLLSLILTLNLWQVLIPMSIMTLGVTLTRATAATCALSSLSTQAGQGASGLNLIQFLFSALIAMAISNIEINSQWILGSFAAISGLSIIILMKQIQSVAITPKLSIKLN